MNSNYDVLVVGGGIVGLTAALAMARRHYHVAVIDGGELTTNIDVPDARVFAINHASKTLFESLGVWDSIDTKRISPYTHMHVWDGVNSASIDFDARTILAPSLGAILEESVIKDALLHRIAQQSNISLYPKQQVEHVECTAEQVKLLSKDGHWVGQLLMIADGAKSPLRDLLGVELTSWPYNHHAIVATVRTEKPHQQTAYQIFNPDGPLAFLPLVDPHHCSIVWSTQPTRVEQLMSLSEEPFCQELSKAFAYRLGQAELISTRHQFPLQMRHVKQYVGHRWLLLGDAAHTIHPLAGLGLNLGLADIDQWLQLLDTHKRSIISKKLLGAYQRSRKHEVWQVILLMEGFKRFFSYTNPPLLTLRGIGLRFCNNFTPLKRLFIQHASGTYLP
jgi:2-polyprenylphenol 6-hydroxylase